MRHIAIFGGSFNPVHWGHLLIAESALSQFTLDKVIWVPTFRPPHKSEGLADFRQRLEMVTLAIADQPAFEVSASDAHRTTVSYAINTLEDLRLSYPDTCWYWVIGVDGFQSLPKWRRSRELASQCCWLVAPRVIHNDSKKSQSECKEGSLQAEAGSWLLNLDYRCQQVAAEMAKAGTSLTWHFLQMPPVGLSSSLVRRYYQLGRSIRYLVPESVRKYITAHKLYS